MDKYIEHKPWGKFEQFCKDERVTIKILTVEPNQQISLQYHKHRDEFWKILKGNPNIIIGNKNIETEEGNEFFVPRRTNHRIIAKDDPVEILEIAFGEFDENDIVRLEDKYNRK